MLDETDLLPLSALQHWAFCPRQCALIHVEQAWSENRLTAEGRALHERVHEAGNESRGPLRVARGLRLRSFALGLTGVADVVEFHETTAPHGVAMPGWKGQWMPFPVEYKRGRPKPDECDWVQLCAQAMCLEEMLHTTIPAGAIFYGQPRRRQAVDFTEALRTRTQETAHAVQALVQSATLPAPIYSAKCERCSLIEICMPKAATGKAAVASYMEAMVKL